MKKITSDTKGEIVKIRDTKGVYHTVNQNDIIETAIQCMQKRFNRGVPLTSAQEAKQHVQLLLSSYEHEVFTVLFLDNKHRFIQMEEMFRGTINAASVYPREVVKAALRHNAAAVMLAHNHPSGDPEPSQSDISITKCLSEALSLIDVRVLVRLYISVALVRRRECVP